MATWYAMGKIAYFENKSRRLKKVNRHVGFHREKPRFLPSQAAGAIVQSEKATLSDFSWKLDVGCQVTDGDIKLSFSKDERCNLVIPGIRREMDILEETK